MLAIPPHSSPVLHALPVFWAVARSLQQSVADPPKPVSASSAETGDVMPSIGQGGGKARIVALAGKASARLSIRVISLRMVEL